MGNRYDVVVSKILRLQNFNENFKPVGHVL